MKSCVLLFRHVTLMCITHIPHRRVMMCLNDKCITLHRTSCDLNFCIYLAKPLNGLEFSVRSLQPDCCMGNVDHKLVSQVKARMFYSLLIIWTNRINKDKTKHPTLPYTFVHWSSWSSKIALSSNVWQSNAVASTMLINSANIYYKEPV